MARQYILRPFGHEIPTSGVNSEVFDCQRSSLTGSRQVLPDFGGCRPASAGLVNCAISERSPDNQRDRINGKIDFLSFIYDSAPVVGFRVMKNDVVTVRKARYPDELAARLENAGPRGEIEYLSGKSRRRLALVAGNSEVVFRSFVTVSYPSEFPCDGKVVKRHLHALLAALRRKCGPLAYLWFLEFQRRGAPHLHLFLDFELPGPLSVMTRKSGRVRKECRVNWQFQDWLSDRWFEIVGSGDELHRKAGAAWEVIEKPDGAARYVAKESYKTFQKQVPKAFQNVGRFWGASRGVTPDEGKMVYCSREQMVDIFGASSMDPDGNPFPVLFSAADAYEKIRDTKRDPVKFREWNSGPHQKTAPFLSSMNGSRTGMNTPRHVRELWHGSILNDSRTFRESLTSDGRSV